MSNATSNVKKAFASTAKGIGFDDCFYNTNLVQLNEQRLASDKNLAFSNLLSALTQQTN